MPSRSAIASWRSNALTSTTEVDVAVGPPAEHAGELTDSIAAAVAASDRGLCLAALPFDATAPSRILTPRRDPDATAARTIPPLTEGDQTDPAAYTGCVTAILDRIAARAAEKVVLARHRDFVGPAPIDPVLLASRLAANRPADNVFALPTGRDSHLVGATTGLLVAKSGVAIRSNPITGVVPQSADPDIDAERGESLLRSRVDRQDHTLVVEAICDVIAPYCRRLVAPAPDLVRTEGLWHLSTMIEAELHHPDIPVAVLAARLHPAPAMCGTPKDAAIDVIRAVEDVDRGYFAGSVGWQNAHGDGEWVPAGRCGEITGNLIRTYTAAAVVADTDPHTAFASTECAMSTILTALGRPAD